MTRTYERETVQWERADIEALVEAGRAQYFPGLPGYVIDKKHPVRNHQIVEAEVAPTLNIPSTDEHNRVLTAEALVEELFTARHGIAEVRDGEFREDEQAMVDALLNSDEAELEHSIREEITELQYKAQEARTGVYIPAPDSADEDALLAKFGV